ncbi:DNA primase catalytic subunit PriS [Candidatus Micrarchaeota archaeon]|nr:DNA primase catalytic subunit PriS [Candidatus Micrarchaeota archaeon]
MNEKERRFVQHHVQGFYQKKVPVPPAVSQREFGFGWQSKIDYRHRGFISSWEYEQFVRQEAPLYMSYSLAYYQFPEKQPMGEKGFQGADLVFDLDSPKQEHDHEPVLCRTCLEDIHQQALQLKKMLEEDFGFQQPKLVFSGQKGFHVHVQSPDVMDLSKDARRQLAEYVAAEGLDASTLFRKTAYDLEHHVKPVETLQGPSSQSTGWTAKIYQRVRRAIQEKDVSALKRYGFSRKTVSAIQDDPAPALSQINSGHWGALLGKDKQPNTESLIADVQVVQTDKAVTYDLSRLIRVPGSIHGSTGFITKPLEDPETFRIRDVLAFDSRQQTTVIARQDLKFEFLDEIWTLPRARFSEVPLPLGIYLACQEKAFIP